MEPGGIGRSGRHVGINRIGIEIGGVGGCSGEGLNPFGCALAHGAPLCAELSVEPGAAGVLLSSDEVGWGQPALPKVLGKAGLTLSAGVFGRVSGGEVLGGRRPSSETPVGGQMQGLSRQRESLDMSTPV